MKQLFTFFVFMMGLTAFTWATGAMASATCHDGTHDGRTNRRGACAGHGGVKNWDDTSVSTLPMQVWVNEGSKIYHCKGSQYYGKTQKGKYMTQAAAKAAGYHAERGKSCS